MKPPFNKIIACISLLSAGICLGSHQWAGVLPSLLVVCMCYRLDKAEAKLRETQKPSPPTP